MIKEYEEWRDIDGYDGRYMVSNLGKIMSLNFNGTHKHKELLGRKTRGGYRQVVLYTNGKRKAFYIHVLVAKTFIPNPNNLPEVNHKDGNKENNTVNNLEWVTSKENSLHAVKTGLRHVPKSGQHYRAVKTAQFDIDGNLIKIWNSMSDPNKIFGYSTQNIEKCCSGKIHSAYGYIWRRVNDN